MFLTNWFIKMDQYEHTYLKAQSAHTGSSNPSRCSDAHLHKLHEHLKFGESMFVTVNVTKTSLE